MPAQGDYIHARSVCPICGAVYDMYFDSEELEHMQKVSSYIHKHGECAARQERLIDEGLDDE